MIRVERSQPAPPSLADGRAPNGQDVQAQLAHDFRQKCAWCEGPAPQFEVDHLRPQGQFPELRCDWNNLLPACNRTCNQRRERRWPEGGLLDCCADDLDGRLSQGFGVHPTAPDQLVMRFSATKVDDLQASNTATLLRKLFDDSANGAELRRRLFVTWSHLLNQMAELRETSDREAQVQAKETLRHMLGPAGPYCGLLRAHLDARFPGWRAAQGLA